MSDLVLGLQGFCLLITESTYQTHNLYLQIYTLFVVFMLSSEVPMHISNREKFANVSGQPAIPNEREVGIS